MTFHARVILLAFSVAFSSALFADQNNQAERYTFGVFPHMPAGRLLALYTPVADDFAEQIKRPVLLLTRPTYDEYTDQLEKENYDIAFIQPFDYPLARRHGYLPVARRSAELKTVLIVKPSSPYRNIADLKGKTVANPAAKAAVSQMTTKAFSKAGLNPDQDVKRIYTRNHFSCMQHVLIGKADACGTAPQAVAHWEILNMERRFHVIHETAAIPHALFVIHERVPATERDKIKAAILSWPERPKGQAILAAGPLVPFAEATDAEYQIVRDYWNEH